MTGAISYISYIYIYVSQLVRVITIHNIYIAILIMNALFFPQVFPTATVRSPHLSWLNGHPFKMQQANGILINKHEYRRNLPVIIRIIVVNTG